MRKTSRVMISTPRAESSSSSSSSSEKTESAEMSSQGVDASGSSNDAKETLSKLAEEGDSQFGCRKLQWANLYGWALYWSIGGSHTAHDVTRASAA